MAKPLSYTPAICFGPAMCTPHRCRTWQSPRGAARVHIRDRGMTFAVRA